MKDCSISFCFVLKKSLKLVILNYSDSNKNKAESELEGKRDELRSKLLADLEDKKKALEIEKLQADVSGNVIDNFEGKNHFTRKLRVRPSKFREDNIPDPNQNSPAQVLILYTYTQLLSHDFSMVLPGLKNNQTMIQTWIDVLLHDDLVLGWFICSANRRFKTT